VFFLLPTAYWIAFGPHGPRSVPPPGEGKKVALYTAIGLGISFAIFGVMRAFARPAPKTMTREWQEATNEYLKVRDIILPIVLDHSIHCRQSLTSHPHTLGPEGGPVDGYLVRGLQGQGRHPVRPGEGVDNRQADIILLLDATMFCEAERGWNHPEKKELVVEGGKEVVGFWGWQGGYFSDVNTV
jgi:hypothetical protein